MSDPKDKDQAADALSQTGESGIELNEAQLDGASGGLTLSGAYTGNTITGNLDSAVKFDTAIKFDTAVKLNTEIKY